MKCEGCNQERKELVNGHCIFCRHGSGGQFAEKKVSDIEHKPRGKEIKTFNEGDFHRKYGSVTKLT